MITEDDMDRLQTRQNAQISPETKDVLDQITKENFSSFRPLLDEYIMHRKKVGDEFADIHLAADLTSILLGNYRDVDKAIAHANSIHQSMILLLQKFDKEVNT